MNNGNNMTRLLISYSIAWLFSVVSGTMTAGLTFSLPGSC